MSGNFSLTRGWGPRWFCISTKSNAEFGVVAAIEELGSVTVFLPLLAEIKSGARRVGPLFPGYIFVFLDLSADGIGQVCRVHGTNKVLGFSSVPSPVRKGVIEGLLAMQNSAGVALDLTAGRDFCGRTYSPGDVVDIVSGPVAGIRGQVIAARGAKLKLMVFLFGGPREMSVPSSQVSPAA